MRIAPSRSGDKAYWCVFGGWGIRASVAMGIFVCTNHGEKKRRTGRNVDVYEAQRVVAEQGFCGLRDSERATC
jgi:hypothetical protein